MGGKGRKRREKNYRAAHGGFTRLPPPPDLAKADALPSKLRKLIAFTSTISEESIKEFKEAKKKRKLGEVASEPKSHPEHKVSSENSAFEDLNLLASQHGNDGGDDTDRNIANEKRKKKRKRNEVKDLRFAEEMKKLENNSKRKEKKKSYLEARKNKQKAKTEDNVEFPGHEKIKFGDIVQAPPKLVVPKAFKTSNSASQERVRLNAIEEYRKRRGWTSRPGILIPSVPEL